MKTFFTCVAAVLVMLTAVTLYVEITYIRYLLSGEEHFRYFMTYTVVILPMLMTFLWVCFKIYVDMTLYPSRYENVVEYYPVND